MFSEAAHPDPIAMARDLLRYHVLSPLTVISVRTELLQRIVQQTPGLNDLERSALLNGLAAILASAQELGSSLDVVIGHSAHPATPPPEEPR
jgi:hypothetical protein